MPSITVHILHDNTLTTDNRDNFSYLAGQYGQRVEFYNVEELCAEKIADMTNLVPTVQNSRLTIAAFYRLLIPYVIPAVNKCIYLDSDILVNLDIAQLWRVELGDKILAAVNETEIEFDPISSAQKKYLVAENLVSGDDYFNSGVLIMNLDCFRENAELIMSGLKWLGEHPQCKSFDQDVLNYLFSKDYIKLPEKFDVFVRAARKRYQKVRNAIYHYIASDLKFDMRDPFNRLWMSYFIKTPFFDEIAVGRLYAGVQRMHVGFKQSMINVSAIMSGKVRAFFTPPNSSDDVKKIFAIRDDEEIILAENRQSLKKLLDAMNDSRGKKVLFFLANNFPFGVLIQAGFVYGRDFVNGFDFLSEAHDFPMDSYPLIQAL